MRIARLGSCTAIVCSLIAVGVTAARAESPPARAWTRPVIHPEAQGPTNSDGSLRVFPDPPADVRGRWLVLDYDAFGPQAMAFGLLGMGWYAFTDGCQCGEVGDQHDVRVVVYQGSLKAAKRQFVVGPTTGDYRFVSVAAARRYLIDGLAELRARPKEDRMPALERELEGLQAALASWFPPRRRLRGG